ncbi:MAG: peptidoglycan bridge formation glycyltransferase FemA/FemB family protein [Bacilli bacterium]|nr:peptidoglycan bridge formation glycyltransferase FemA/FemB family protein [Bacilli bacterium]
MKLVQLGIQEFHEFANTHKYNSFYQSQEYARFMEDNGFEYDIMGIKDSFENIRAASLILFKNIDNKYKFGYAPRGFLIDYDDRSLVNDFAKSLSKYYKHKHIIFIKINPNIYISKYNKNKNEYIYNDNVKYIDYLKKNKFQNLKKNKYFESILPTFSPLVDLKRFTYKELDKNVRNKISKCYRKGLSIDKVSLDSIEELYPLIKNKTKKSLTYYKNLYHAFEKNKQIDLFLIKVDFEEFLINTKDKYLKTQALNNTLVNKIIYDKSSKLLKQKLQSDRELETLENDIVIATQGLSENKTKVIAGAITIKYKNKVTIFVSGYDKKYRDLNSIDFLYYKLIEYYKYNYEFLDLDGFSGDVSETNPFIGLNNFKMGFNPEVYEDIGEFDIIFKNSIYNKIASNGTLSKLFNNLKQ